VLTVSGSLALLQSCANVDRSTDACDRRVDRHTTIRRKRQL